jgi:hypothetical protein
MKKKRKYLFLGFLCLLLGGLGLFVYTAWSEAQLHAETTSVGRNGSYIWKGLYSEALEAEMYYSKTKRPTIWPVSGQFRTSTDFFKVAMSNKWFERIKGVNFSFFGATGLKTPEDPTNPALFLSENNAWGIVPLSITNEAFKVHHRHNDDDTPFLFTKNIGFGTPPGPAWEGATIADMNGLLPDVKPFGKHVAIIITYGGDEKLLTAKHATRKLQSRRQHS